MDNSALFSEPVLHRLNAPGVSRLVIGFSGGVDSVVLLHALITALPNKKICALHINHRLQPAADAFADFCRAFCNEYQVDIEVREVEVPACGSQEAGAREARYRVFEAFLEPGDLLLLAHHRDDQVETLLFRLFRGSRVPGLEGMPVERSIGQAGLYRPLLELSRAQLEDYARRKDLRWIDDPTNEDRGPDRNYIRHAVLPVIEARWPKARSALLNGLGRDGRMREKLQRSSIETLRDGRPTTDSLDINWLRKQTPPDIVDLLTAWLLDLALPLPAGGMLNTMARALASGQFSEAVAAEIEFRCHEDRLYVLKPLPAIDGASRLLQAGSNSLPGGRLISEQAKGRGLVAKHAYRVVYRHGGEKFRRRRGRSLKNLFQEHHVPHWLRDRVPLLYHDDELVAVAALPGWGLPMLVADGWAAGPADDGCQVSLELNDRFSAG